MRPGLLGGLSLIRNQVAATAQQEIHGMAALEHVSCAFSETASDRVLGVRRSLNLLNTEIKIRPRLARHAHGAGAQIDIDAGRRCVVKNIVIIGIRGCPRQPALPTCINHVGTRPREEAVAAATTE